MLQNEEQMAVVTTIPVLTQQELRDKQRQLHPQTLEDLHFAWKTDAAESANNDPAVALDRLPSLHQKYSKLLLEYMNTLRKFNSEYAKLQKAKYSYYRGDMNSDLEELKKRGWEPNPKKIDTTQLKYYLDGDDDLIDLREKIGTKEDEIKYIESIISTIKDRSYQLQSKIKWKMFIMDGSE